MPWRWVAWRPTHSYHPFLLGLVWDTLDVFWLGFDVLRLGFEVMGLGFEVSGPAVLEPSCAGFNAF